MLEQNNPTIYLICGKARVGKDTFCDFMIEAFNKQNNKAIEMKCSRYIKNYAIDYFGWNGSEETKPRDFLNLLGTDIIRKRLNKPYFLPTRVCEDIQVLSYFFNNFIVSDVRLKTEIEIFKKYFSNVKIICLKRPVNYENGLSVEQEKHITEVDLDDFDGYDYIIDNDGTLEDLRVKAEKLINS